METLIFSIHIAMEGLEHLLSVYNTFWKPLVKDTVFHQVVYGLI